MKTGKNIVCKIRRFNSHQENTMFEKKFIIVGGSIAGCALAVLLQNAKYQVRVLERSSGEVKKGNGTGITLPNSLINECIEQGLLDKNIPLLPADSRSFSRKDLSQNSITFWNQNLQVVTLNWKQIYENLRSRINKAIYHPHTEVKNIHKIPGGYQVETHNGELIEADYIIAADGSNSLIRNLIAPDSRPQYSGYIAWRGVLELSESETLQYARTIPYYLFKNGHILLYQIPDITWKTTGKVLLNWVLYQTLSEDYLQDFLVDKHGIRHSASIPAGSLGKNHLSHLESLINTALPNHIASIIKRTREPFLQVVHDFQLHEYSDNHIAFIGDAALTLRPHTASGVLKALRNAIDLFDLIHNLPVLELDKLIPLWQAEQHKIASVEVSKSLIIGENLVINTPDWEKMNQEITELWWKKIMEGKGWYALTESDNSLFKKEIATNHSVENDLSSTQMAKL